MAARKPVKVTAPVKQKVRKNHGPKRHMFHDYSSTIRLAYGRAGILNKYYNFESFALALNARGIRENLKERWTAFCLLPTEARKQYFKNLSKNMK